MPKRSRKDSFMKKKRIDIDPNVKASEQAKAKAQPPEKLSSSIAEGRLQENEALLNSFFDSPGVMRGIVEVINDVDIKHIRDNVVTARYVGLTPADLQGRASSELGEPVKRIKLWLEHYKRSQLSGQPVSFEYLDKQGSNESWLAATVTFLGTASSGHPRFAYIVTDVTERKKAEEALRRAHEELEMRVEERTKELTEASRQLQAEIAERKRAEEDVKTERKRLLDVLEMLPAYLILLTPDYHVSYANRFFRERFGENRGHKRCFEYLFGRTEPCKTCETYKALKTMSSLEWEWTGPDGRNYHIYDSPFIDTDDSTLIMEVGIDITERKKAEEALRRAHEELEMRVEERTKELTEASRQLQAEIAERKRAEEDLRQTSDYLQNLFDYANAPIICWDPEFKITRFNHAFEHLTGHKAKEVFGKDLSMLFPEESREQSLTKIQNTLVGEHWEIVEIPIQRKDGEVRIVLWNSANIYATDGKTLTATIAQGQDITDRKLIENELRETSDYLNSLLDYANAPIIVWNPDYRIARFNHAFERLTGLEAEDVIGKPLEILFPEDNKEESMRHINRASSGEYWQVVEIPILRTDGLVRTVLWNSANILSKDGTTVVATIAQGEDITKRKQTEKALLESQIDLNRAQAVANIGSWRLNIQRNELLWSDETHRIFGIPKGTPLTYETFHNTVHQDDRGYVNQTWQAAMRGEPYDIEYRIVVDGAVKWVREKAELEFNKDGVLLSGFGTVQEVTEKKEMHDKLEEYSKHLEELVEEKTQKLKDAERLITIGETAGMVGHDIRNPLQSIEGAVYLAKEELQSLPTESEEKKELLEILEIVEAQIRYIDHIVADLQDFARTPIPQPKETNIQELMVEALSTIGIPKNIDVHPLFQEDLQKLIIDPTILKRVFLNLIENAIQAMPNGGKLTLKVFTDYDALCICIEDTGVGIAEEHKKKMFTPLFTTKAKGQGFGLAVCKKLVEANGGEITFESEVGKGTKFKIRLPLKKEAN